MIKVRLVPELPDITLYLEGLDQHLVGQTLAAVRVKSPFVVRSYDPPIRSLGGHELRETRRLGKRLVLGFSGDVFLVVHLMVAGRLWLKAPKAALSAKTGLLSLDFPRASLVMTEAGSKKRASVHVVRGEDGLAAHDPGGLDPLFGTIAQFKEAILKENHTLKRCLTDPRLLSGIGNAYSDEILHAARLSPVRWSQKLTDEEMTRLHEATRNTLLTWTERLRRDLRGAFPGKVTAFREEMAVHGKYGKPCPVCQTPVQRIRRQDSEVNYCPACQTGGKLLADRGLSRLLRGDWPKTLSELEQRGRRGRE